ncbi:hypothetical protein FLL46_00150 [Aliikangiella coralliicola]|uniref:Glycine zipper 2TM domain-containing protein n=2 Tax=Aliikangiella coralliicola TaxID=2592383 RepID=A0A545UIP1_9GAMM|nr:hypothetical protein FLL46_00150 [Aliikangiella coralliicola]
MKNIFFGLMFGLALSGCANKGVNLADAEQLVEVIYAKVLKTKPITFDSKAGQAAVMGGIEGAIENSDGDSEDLISGAITGAIVSSVFVSIEEGSSRGLLVSMRTADNTDYNLATKNTKIKVDECLQIIRGADVSLIKVEDSFCQN